MTEDRKCPTNFGGVSHVEFQQNVWNSLWATWKSSSMAVCKLGFVRDPLS
jgi:hypothetical protein